MLKLICDGGRPLSAEFWLLLAIMTSTSGFVLTFSRFFEFPWSWFMALVCVNAYRLIFGIKPSMPILLDIGVSLLLQWVVIYGGMKWAVSVASVLIERTFCHYYFSPLLEEHMRVMAIEPESKPLTRIISPLRPNLFAIAMLEIYAVNGCVLMVAWFCPQNGKMYYVYEAVVGLIMVFESFDFLACYKQLGSEKEAPSSSASSSQGGCAIVGPNCA